MNDNFDFGSKLKEYRKKNNMTQAQLARILGKSPSTIYGYESNQILPSFDTLCMISSTFSADIEELLELRSPQTRNRCIREYYFGLIRQHEVQNNED